MLTTLPPFLLIKKSEDDQERHPRADCAVSDVESRPVIAPELEVQKIDHEVIPQAIDQIAHRPSQNEPGGDAKEGAPRKKLPIENQEEDDNQSREGDKDDRMLGEQTESGPPVMDQS